MIRAAVLALTLAAPAAAQGVPLPGPMQPCIADHFDPARYRAELEAIGWTFIPAMNRAAQTDRLARAFAALSVPEGTAPEDMLAEARLLWVDRSEESMIFDGGGQTLMISGVAESEIGTRAVICYVALLTASDLDPAFEAARLRDATGLQDDATQIFSTTYAEVRPDQDVTVTFARPNPDRSDPARLASTPAGLATRLDLPALPE